MLKTYSFNETLDWRVLREPMGDITILEGNIQTLLGRDVEFRVENKKHEAYISDNELTKIKETTLLDEF